MAEIREPVIVDTVRTAFGKRGGALAGWHPADLLGFTLTNLLERNDLDPNLVDDVVGGCVTQAGEQGCNVTRNAWVAGGLPQRVPATSVDRQCGSSQQAMHFVAASVMAGVYDLAIACGVESMSWAQFRVAQVLADSWKISREEMDAYALESHRRAAVATDSGHFANEILPVPRKADDGSFTGETLAADEGIRRGGTPESLATLPPAQSWEPDTAPDITAGNSSQMTDGAAAIALMWAREFVPDMERLNPRGGAIAIGHPLGASGVRIATTLLNHLEATGGRLGFQTMCEGGGQANATVIERL